MERWTSLAAMLSVGAGVFAAGHYYLWARLIRDTGIGVPDRRALLWILGALVISFPLAVVGTRLVPPAVSGWWITPVYYWLGVSLLLVLSVAAVDLLRLGHAVITFGFEGVDPSRRRALARLGAAVALTVGLGAGAWAALEGRRIRVKRVEIPLKKLPKGLDGLRIVQLTDVHVGPTIGGTFIQRVVAMVNGLSPDIVAITGDLVDGSVEDLRGAVAPLANLTSTYGAYFVTGNHEYHADAVRWCEHLGHLGVRVLRNERVEIKRDGDAFDLAGVDDYEAERIPVGHRMDLPKAVAGRDPSRALVLLAHQPKAVHEAARHGVDLQLSGHTHGGQLWPMGWLQRLAQPVVAGLARFGETFVYVSCGTGHSGPPMRLGAPAEITEIVLRADSRPAGHAVT
jgi:predicted MPP superfamily phosphohydrolase